MAGDWIAIRCDLATEPEVIAIADATGLDEFAVVGRLHRLWSWANRHTVDGNGRSVTYSWVDRYLQQEGFAMAMEVVGWLTHDGYCLTFPKFDRFNSQGGKQRLLTAKRVSDHKRKGNAQGNAKGNAPIVTLPLPKEQNRTEEKRREQEKGDTPLPPGFVLPESIRSERMDAAVTEWLAYKSEKKDKYTPMGLKKLMTQISNAVAKHGESNVIAMMDKAMASGWKGWDHADNRGSPVHADDPRGNFTAAQQYLESLKK